MLQRKLSGHSSPSSSSPPPSIPSSGAGGHPDAGSAAGAGAESPSAPTAAARTNMAEQFSIAEMLARGMYGSDGIGAARQQNVGGGGGGGGGVSSDVLDESSSSLQAATPSTGVQAGESAGTTGAGPQGGGMRLEEGSAAEGAADATSTATVTAAPTGADDAAQAGGLPGAGTVDEDAGGGGKEALQLGTAPSHGSTRGEVGVEFCLLSFCLPDFRAFRLWPAKQDPIQSWSLSLLSCHSFVDCRCGWMRSAGRRLGARG